MIKRKVAIFSDTFGVAICGLLALVCYKSAYTSVLVLNPVNQLAEKYCKHVSHNKEFYEWRLPLPLGSI